MRPSRTAASRVRPSGWHDRRYARAMIFEPVQPFLTSAYTVKYATEMWERREAAALRRQVFCVEQAIFPADDYDDVDALATHIVALSSLSVAHDDVVGTVRIHEAEPGTWWGSRLAVAAAHRRVGALGAGLIRLAVSSAHARGCTTFLAHVQVQNALLFRRLYWDTVGEVELHGRPHLRMQADLAFYPPFATPDIGFMALRKAA